MMNGHIETGSVRMRKELLEQAASKVLQAVGVPKPEADIVSRVLLFADQRGIESHGISKLPIYVKRILDGGVDPKGIPTIIGGKGAVVCVDGKNSLGPVGGAFGMERAIEAARTHGIGLASVRNSNHFGVTAYYSMMALSQGMIGFAFSNANPTVAPWGGEEGHSGHQSLVCRDPLRLGTPLRNRYGHYHCGPRKDHPLCSKQETSSARLGFGCRRKGNHRSGGGVEGATYTPRGRERIRASPGDRHPLRNASRSEVFNRCRASVYRDG